MKKRSALRVGTIAEPKYISGGNHQVTSNSSPGTPRNETWQWRVQFTVSTLLSFYLQMPDQSYRLNILLVSHNDYMSRYGWHTCAIMHACIVYISFAIVRCAVRVQYESSHWTVASSVVIANRTEQLICSQWEPRFGTVINSKWS
jgi:hypothetical protein